MDGDALQLMNNIGEQFGVKLMSSVLNRLSVGACPGPGPQMSHLQHLVVTEGFRVDRLPGKGRRVG